MATTTNYGWTTPDDTALVKDGAAAIRTLGSSIDTSVKALSPGTTAGDVDYYTATTTKARLAIGTTGQVLTVAGGVPSWATPTSGSMTLLSTTALSTNSVTVSSISGSYNALQIILTGVTTSDAARFRIAPNGSTNITETTYFGFTGAAQQGGVANSYMAFPLDTTVASSQLNITININNYASTSVWKSFSYAGGISATTVIGGAGQIETTSAISSLVFSLATGGHTFTGGSVLIYGVK
jgi:hypothetical protein